MRIWINIKKVLIIFLSLFIVFFSLSAPYRTRNIDKLAYVLALGLDIGNSNYPTIAMSRWTGEGTSDTYPRLVSNDPNGNFGKMSDFYLEKGDYLRLKIVQIGYSLPNNPFFTKIGLSRLRVYITAENLLTLTNYTGYEPEVGGGVFGIDKGQYPQARSFIGGIQVQF